MSKENKEKKEKKEKRFVVLEEQRLHVGIIRIMADMQTGVNYIFASDETNCSITPLLDDTGKAVVTDPAALKAKEEAEKQRKEILKAAKKAVKKEKKNAREAKPAAEKAQKGKTRNN